MFNFPQVTSRLVQDLLTFAKRLLNFSKPRTFQLVSIQHQIKHVIMLTQQFAKAQ